MIDGVVAEHRRTAEVDLRLGDTPASPCLHARRCHRSLADGSSRPASVDHRDICLGASTPSSSARGRSLCTRTGNLSSQPTGRSTELRTLGKQCARDEQSVYWTHFNVLGPPLFEACAEPSVLSPCPTGGGSPSKFGRLGWVGARQNAGLAQGAHP